MMKERIAELKIRIFSLTEAEEAELLQLMRERNAVAGIDPAAEEREETERQETARPTRAEEWAARGEKAEKFSQFVDSHKRESVCFRGDIGHVYRWEIPDGISLLDAICGTCRWCEAPIHSTSMGGVTACENGHFFDMAFDTMSLRDVLRWIANPAEEAALERLTPALEWAILGRKDE